MSLDPLYKNALTDSIWSIPQDYETLFDWNYSDDRQDLLNLYGKGKDSQWDAETRIDWSQELNSTDAFGMPEELFPLFGSDVYNKMSVKEKSALRYQYQAYLTSQFLHGEQGALLCAAKIVQNVPNAESKFYAATQVMDEARHVEAYKKLIEKFGVSYPITGPLKTLLDQVLRDKRWDMTYLGMQVVIEGLALAAFANIRDTATNNLASSVNAYVMQDEARHVAFGRLSLREYYPELSQYERDEREEFVVEACYLMRDRFRSDDLWDTLGLPAKECARHQEESYGMQVFRTALFSRIVPVVKDIGLWGPKIQDGYGKMGILGFAQQNIDDLQENDARVADEYDARRNHVESMINKGRETS